MPQREMENQSAPNASLPIRFGELPSRKPARRGGICPQCGEDILDYNGLLDLECPRCRYTESGGGGCT